MIKYKHIYKSGNSYEGNWFGGFRHGEGKMIFTDGSTYEGFFNLGKAHGVGVFSCTREDLIYDGEWYSNYMHGKGIHKNNLNGIQYEGYLKFDNQHGPGREEWPDGIVFQGLFHKGAKH